MEGCCSSINIPNSIPSEIHRVLRESCKPQERLPPVIRKVRPTALLKFMALIPISEPSGSWADPVKLTRNDYPAARVRA